MSGVLDSAFGGLKERGLVKFNLGDIPPGSTVNSASLQIYLKECNPSAAADSQISANRVTDIWTETSVTWNNKPAYTATGSSSLTVPNTVSKYYSWDVVTVVSGWWSGSNPNYGFLVRSSAEDTTSLNERGFLSSRENRDPLLKINYTPEHESPNVTITTPTSQPGYATSSSPVLIGGSASDNYSVATVTWANAANALAGTASGTTTWSATIPLVEGANPITITATDLAGNQESDGITITYSAADTTAPSVPTNLVAAATSPTQIFLSWSAATDSGGSGLAGYVIYRDGQALATNIALTYLDVGLAINHQYCYTVVSYDQAGNFSGQSSSVCATTPCSYLISPLVTNISAGGGTGSFTVVTLGGCTWTASTADNWIHTTNSGTGDGLVNYIVDANTSVSLRSGTIAVGGQAFTVNQRSIDDQTQPPRFQWAKQATGDSTEQGQGIAVDSTGNVYVTGNFSGAPTFGGTTLTNNGGYNIFVVKYDNAGNLVWARQATGSHNGAGYGVVVEAAGNVYLAGNFSGTATFGTNSLTSSGDSDVFLAKYDSSGNVLWAKQVGGSLGDDLATSLALDTNGNVYVTGWFSGSATFGTTTLTSTGSEDIFVVKYNGSGNVAWATNVGGPSSEWSYGIAVDEVGNCYVTGIFAGTTTIGGTNLSSGANYGVVVAKFNTTGHVLWAKTAGGSGDTLGYSIAVDGAGNSHVIGDFRGTVTFGSTTLSNILSFGDEVFIAKYDSAGNALWAQQGVGSSDDHGRGIAVDGAGVCYVTGLFNGNANIGGINLASSGGDDVFVARYDSAGNLLWAKSAGGSAGDDGGYNIAVDAMGSEYITGQFAETATFDGITLNKSGFRNVFIAKLALSISIERLGTGLRLTWTSGTLFSADDVNGPWNPVIGASSPWMVTPNSPNKFYRLQQ